MKQILFAFSLFFITGCASVGSFAKKTSSEVAIVRDAITDLFPSDFSGPIDIHRDDSYMEITFKADGVRKNDKGEWTWKWVDYERKTHIPWFAGAQWTSNVHIKLGAP